MSNTKCLLIGMVSGMIVLKSIEMVMDKKNMSCNKAMDGLENKMKKEMNKLNSKVQQFDFDKWKEKTVNTLKGWLDKVENLTNESITSKKDTKDLFKQMSEETSCCYDCNYDD